MVFELVRRAGRCSEVAHEASKHRVERRRIGRRGRCRSARSRAALPCHRSRCWTVRRGCAGARRSALSASVLRPPQAHRGLNVSTAARRTWLATRISASFQVELTSSQMRDMRHIDSVRSKDFPSTIDISINVHGLEYDVISARRFH